MAYSMLLFFNPRRGSFLFLRRQPAVAAAPDDEEVLSLDLEDDEYLYRIRRGSRIIYASVLYTDIVPPDHRTDGFRVLSKLRNVPRWGEKWQTLTIRKGAKGSSDTIESTADEFTPHGLGSREAQSSLRLFLQLFGPDKRTSDQWFPASSSASRREIRYIQQELSIYSILESHRFPLSPRLIGLVYEETKDRTIGFLMEEIQGGEYPGIKDIENCSETLRRLHGTGIIHGDVNRYNFLLTEDGAKIFDFETSTTRFDEGVASREIESLWKWLGDDSGMGRE